MSERTADRGASTGVVADELIGLHHVGIPVRSIDESLSWYRDLFGLEPDFLEVLEGPDTSQIVQLENVRMRFAFLRMPNAIIELLEYEHPVGADFELRNCDVGAIHLCLEVSDIDHVYRVLAERGITFSTSRPINLTGPLAGQACCYFRDPNGIQLELWQRSR